DRQALMRRRQDIGARIGVERGEFGSAPGAAHDAAWRRIRSPLQDGRIVGRVPGGADEHQFPYGSGLPAEGRDKVELTLFRNESSNIEYVFSRCKAEALQQQWSFRRSEPWRTVWNCDGRPRTVEPIQAFGIIPRNTN